MKCSICGRDTTNHINDMPWCFHCNAPAQPYVPQPRTDYYKLPFEICIHPLLAYYNKQHGKPNIYIKKIQSIKLPKEEE